MKDSAKNRSSIRQLASDQFDFWPKPDISQLDNDASDSYLNRYRAMEMYCAGASLEIIGRITGVKGSTICYYAGRCTQLAPDGEVYGCRALLPHLHIVQYERRKECRGKLPGVRGGYAGALQATLKRYPDIDKCMIGHIKKIKQSQILREHKISPSTLHSIFINSLKEQGASLEEWPFNTRTMGYNSICKYMREVLLSDFSAAVTARGDKPAKAHLSVGHQDKTLIRADDPYDIVEIDSYHTDCHVSVLFKTPEGTYASVLINRIWLIAMIDRASTAILEYKLVYRPEVASADVIDVIRLSLSEHKRPPPSIETLLYPADGGFPKDVIAECKYALPSVIMLDGALANLATKVHDGARKELGFALNWGPVGHFERRPNIERFFGRIHKELFAKLLSTTGSNPYNGRAEKAEEMAVVKNIHADHIHHLLDVIVAEHNCTRTEGLSFLTPLEFIRQKISFDNGHLLIRHLPNAEIVGDSILMLKKKVTVRGGVASGRLPYIQLDRVRYTSDLLRDAALLIGKPIVVYINEEDMRTVKAFTMDGRALGVLYAGGRWGDSKHDMRTRKIINSLVNEKIINVALKENPVQVYFNWLTQENIKNSNAKNRQKRPITPTQGSEAKRVADAAGIDLALTIPKPMPALKVGVRRLEMVTDSVIPDEMPDLIELLKSTK